MPDPTPPAAPPADPPAPPPATPPDGDPPAPTRDDVIRDPQALIDALGAARTDARRLERWKKDRERADAQAADAARTELERLTDRATTAEGNLATRDLQLLRTEVALEQLLGDDPRVKLAIALAARLQGTTREEIVADAASMRQLLGQQQPGPAPPTPPPAGGSRLGNGAPAATGDAAFTSQLRRAAGYGS